MPSTTGISLLESVRVAWETMRGNALRSALTALGVIIGVAAVVALLALGRGSQQQVAESITANGANLLTVIPGSLGSGGFSSSGSERQLTMRDVAALSDPANVPAARAVSPEYSSFATLVAGSRNTSALVIGATTAYAPIHNHTLAAGAFFDEGQTTSGAPVAVLGSTLAAQLFPEGDAVGQRVRVGGQRFRVVGVLATKGRDAFGLVDTAAVIPLAAAQRLFGAIDRVSGRPLVSAVVVQASAEALIDDALAQVAATLREQHRLASDAPDDFTIDNQQQLITTLTESQRTLTLYMGSIAAISLLVGGIGIMNIMLVSVRERTREIGLRKAVGARKRDILTQFLVEALVLSTGGGLIGLVAGVAIALGVEQFGQSRAIIRLDSILLAVGFALLIGLFFGIEPARRAARLNPIDALRYE